MPNWCPLCADREDELKAMRTSLEMADTYIRLLRQVVYSSRPEVVAVARAHLDMAGSAYASAHKPFGAL